MLKSFGRMSGSCLCCPEPPAATEVSRRGLLLGAGAAVAAAAAGSFPTPLIAQSAAQATRRIIDVHHHIATPNWLEAMKELPANTPGGRAPPLLNWSVQKTIEDMDRGGVTTAITSATTPQVSGLQKPLAVRIARDCNEYAKRMEIDHPGRFGTFAVLPLPHLDETLKEIEYAFDTLKVDGVTCMTSYGDKWLGYAEFEPVWAELNRRKATVYTHPAAANCCVNLVRGLDEAWIEFGTDTARTIGSLLFSGTSLKYPDINWIWSHGGGALTAFVERFLVVAVNTRYRDKFSRAQIEGELKRFYYDTAQVSNPVTLSAMMKLMPMSQIVYGTDFPFRTAADHTRSLSEFFSPQDFAKLGQENALRLFPRLRA